MSQSFQLAKELTGIEDDIASLPLLYTLVGDQLFHYKASDTDTGSDTKYYGFVDKNENWYIIKEVTTDETFRYVKGSSAYATAWSNRASQTYDYFYNVF